MIVYIFVGTQFMYTVATVIPSALVFQYFELHALYLATISLICVWNGANFYLYVFLHYPYHIPILFSPHFLLHPIFSIIFYPNNSEIFTATYQKRLERMIQSIESPSSPRNGEDSNGSGMSSPLDGGTPISSPIIYPSSPILSPKLETEKQQFEGMIQ